MSIKFKSYIIGACLATLPLLIAGCSNQEKIEHTKQLTVGKIQYDITKGMYSSKVIKALGSPNIITKTKEGKITWVYDKIKTYRSKTTYGGLDFVRMNNNDYAITAGLAAAGGAIATTGNPALLASIAALGLLTYASTEDDYQVETQQKTLTLILDFNEKEQLQEFAYMYSSF